MKFSTVLGTAFISTAVIAADAVSSVATTKTITVTNGSNVYTKVVTDSDDPVISYSTTRTVVVSNSDATYTKVVTEGPDTTAVSSSTIVLTNVVGSSTNIYTKTIAETAASSTTSSSSSSSGSASSSSSGSSSKSSSSSGAAPVLFEKIGSGSTLGALFVGMVSCLL